MLSRTDTFLVAVALALLVGSGLILDVTIALLSL